jgi:flavin-dependent dehydrogenase
VHKNGLLNKVVFNECNVHFTEIKIMKNLQNFGSREHPFDFLISGAGPVGLAAAIMGRRKQKTVCVCEQGAMPGPIPRGETLHDDPIFSELLGEGFLKSIAVHQTDARVLNSPGCVKSFEIHRPTPSLLFDWRPFIDRFWQQAIEAGVEGRLNAKVVNYLLEEGRCIGIELENGSQVYGRTVLACDGHQSMLGRKINIPYEKINVPILKRIVSNYVDPYPGMTTFLIPAEFLAYAPKFPPVALYVFPRGQGKCEVGLSLFVHAARKLKSCTIPDDAEIARVFNQLAATYPKFSNLLNGTKTESEYITKIPTGGLFEPPMPLPGLIFLGDSAGFIKTTSGSGILASIQLVKNVIDYCIQENVGDWTPDSQKKFNKVIPKAKIYRKIKLIYWAIDSFQTLILVKLKTPEKINKKWWLFRLVTGL